MKYTYGVIFLLSLVLAPLYFVLGRKKAKEPWLFIHFICVSIVNLGYTMIAFSQSVDFAIFANVITYLGQVVMPLCMFMLIYKLCGYPRRRWLVGILIGLAVLMYAVILTTLTDLGWYYTGASIETVAGATVLKKEYGFLHSTNLIYVVLYFVAMLTVTLISIIKRRSASQKNAIAVLIIVLGNIVMW